ncbi:precorrin-6y C5,15-methyltransferase (decarboxylating) subunit CbiE [Mycolicibacterium brumae]|uniref:Bifunctional cobalt-precorrin-7 (C(5))-methyltransferase CbiE/decarboxylating cobalt-precorrin-6B (C(15))-methyltransferase CbiT n=1 Tax=Mycolicibacterium brumae TaxID=85968 RepID=A0A2G5PB49_9MYCO|nr:precorrin-6y C5,15-methyltransferase (decarboxylating) subunit CbiE [Mycolicibacterium brumae]MCV7192939.1 precorrin-6y C5,15-methyltransferase (decarboxylating) subunit CbiE [Mycolicibacterium brumae]PIB75223.1 bifunctional cobalt-precorrin-7 (C(5))-methyltransferase CbiE/decarboxylating cobalt-precorrin-6B (C(15))-methyltransferase CbiT [Mycolicibacterium brumae]RWA23528.1 hypothetical protein MBRU_01505 [Mycolicibacterium brumae DSM 44177]UWW08542.1 precorrin-6y C5,15-methyltransferase (d
MIVVVGIGADGMAGLGAAALAELRGASVVYGSPRQLDLLDDTVTSERRSWPTPLLPALESLLADVDGDAHVVASGDPMLHGIGATLVRTLGAERVRVLPTVSSVALACARLGWALEDTEVIRVTEAEPVTAVRRGGQAVALSRDAGTPAALASLLAGRGRGDSEMTVLEQLGGPRERVRAGTAAQWADAPPVGVDPLNVVAVRYLPDERVLSIAPDDAFDHDGQLTKQSIRAVTLAALAPRPGELLWDVGAGSGSVAVEWCRAGSGCRAVAFERDTERAQRITGNAAAFGVSVPPFGAAPASFDNAPEPDAIFIGGGLTAPGLLDECLKRLRPGGRLVANAVTAESEAVLAQAHSQHGGALRRFQHYTGEPIGSFTGYRPSYPVSQWVLRR